MAVRRYRRVVVAVACGIGILAGTSTGARQGRQETSTEIRVADRYALASALNTLARQGFRVDAVATPEAPFLPQNVVVVLSRQAAAAQPPVDYRVVSDARVGKVEADVNALAANGYVLKGVTLATGSVIGSGFAFVAVLERGVPPVPLRQYRLVHTRGTSGDWKVLEQAGRDGFDVTDVIAQVDPNRSAAGDITFVCEKRADGAPVTFTLKGSGDAARVERDVNVLAAAGHTLRAMWPGTSVLSALLSLASTPTPATKQSYEVDADPITVPDVSSMSGRLIAWVRFKDEQVAAFDRAGSGRYEMVTDPVPDADSFRSTRVERARDRVDGFVRKGYRPFWARYARDDKGALTLSVILSLEQRSP